MPSFVSEVKQSPHLQRHYLYLKSRNRLTKAYDCRLETEHFDAQFILDIGNYVRKVFCNTEEKDFIVGDSIGKAKMCTLTLENLMSKENCLSRVPICLFFLEKIISASAETILILF